MSEKGVGLKGGSLHEGFDGLRVFGGSKIQHKQATVTVLTVLAVSVMMATPPPLNSTPLSRYPDECSCDLLCRLAAKPSLVRSVRKIISHWQVKEKRHPAYLLFLA